MHLQEDTFLVIFESVASFATGATFTAQTKIDAAVNILSTSRSKYPIYLLYTENSDTGRMPHKTIAQKYVGLHTWGSISCCSSKAPRG